MKLIQSNQSPTPPGQIRIEGRSRWRSVGAARALLFGAFLMALAACPSKPSGSKQQAGAVVEEGSASQSEYLNEGEPIEEGSEFASDSSESGAGAATSGQLAHLSAADLDPKINPVGTSGLPPERLEIQFALPVVSGARNANRKRTKLSITPAVKGKLRWTSNSTLSFEPEVAFLPATRYRVHLGSVESINGALKAPSKQAWSNSFKTPDFSLARAVIDSVDYGRRRATLKLQFTAPVAQEELPSKLQVTLNGNRVRQTVQAIRGPGFTRAGRLQSSVFSVELTGHSVKAGETLKVQLFPGLKSAGDSLAIAPSFDTRLKLAGGQPWEVKKIGLSEGGNGFFVQVVCNDSAVKGHRYYYDRNLGQSFPHLSPRCQLDEEEAEDWVYFSPKVKFSIAPSGGGFRIFGDFKRGAYSLEIGAGAPTKDGGVLLGTVQKSFTVPARKPQLRFVAKGRYLPRADWKQLPIAHMNLASAELVVRVVPERNLVYWMSKGSETVDTREGDVEVRKTLDLHAGPDELKTSWIDVSKLIPAERRGLIELRLQGSGLSDSSRVVLTDLNLVAKRSGSDPKHPWGRSVRVWALGAKDGALLSGVKMDLIRPSGSVLASCTTDSDEGCDLALPEPDIDKTSPFAIIAHHGEDLSYLKFSELELKVEDAQVFGESYTSRRKYRAYAYSDRGVYRPGETAHLVALVRREAGEAPKAGMPVRFKLRDPQSKVIRSRKLKTDGSGLVRLDQRFADFATTGRYQLQVIVGKRQIGNYGFQVEEFVPERMKVEVQATQPGFQKGEGYSFGVDARYLFGGVPSDHRVELTCDMVPARFSPKGLSNYSFSPWRESVSRKTVQPLKLGSASGTLNAEGGARLTCPGPKEGGSLEGPARVIAHAAVFEAGSGRATVNSASVMVHPEHFYIGLRSPTQRVREGKETKVEGLVVDWAGKPSPELREVALSIYHLEDEWGWYYDSESGSNYRHWRRKVREERMKVPVKGGKFEAKFVAKSDWSGFVVVARGGAVETGLELRGQNSYSYYWGYEEGERDSTPRPDKPSWLKVKGPSTLDIGQEASFSFVAPFKGRVLMSAETDTLVKTEWLEVEAGPVQWKLTLDSFKPNIYVSAMLFLDPSVQGENAPAIRRAFGVQSFTMRPTLYTHPITLSLPKEVRSNSTLTVSLDLGPLEAPAQLTLAAVDEGILSLTKFKSPDPFPVVFPRRSLGVSSYETVGWSLLIPPGSPSSSTGGDEEEGEAGSLGRVQPVHPVALWKGGLTVPVSGKLSVTLNVPEYRGQLRVMVVSAGPKKMGFASKKVLVRDPLVVQATLPRFLTQGDSIAIPVYVTNLSGKKQTVKVSVKASALHVPGLTGPAGEPSPVKILGDGLKTLSLKNEEGKDAVVRATVVAASGAVHIVVTARAAGLSFKQENDLPILPSGPKVRTVQTIELEAGTRDLTPYLKGYVPLSERSSFWVTNNPYAPAFDHLRYLMRYPYGCIEQTTSSARPLLYLAEQVQRVAPELAANHKVEDMVLAGIERIFSMQTPSGGFAYWPGGDSPTPWGTAYAIHFLLDAKEKRYPVSASRLKDAINWLESQLRNYQGFNPHHAWRYYWGYYDEPYVLYVLARAGRSHKGRAATLLNKGFWWDAWWSGAHPYRVGANAEAKYLLEAAIYLSGDRRYEQALKNPDLTPFGSDTRHNGWGYYSDRRARALMLNVFTELFKDDPKGEPLARAVFQRLQGHASGYYTTQELAWSISGLAKRLPELGGQFDRPELFANGKKIKAQRKEASDKSPDKSWALYRASEYDSLKLKLPAKKGKVYLILSSEGVRTDTPFKVGGEGLKLSRNWYREDGSRLGAAQLQSLKLGEVVYVKLQLENQYPEDVNNIALVDRLPAGLEIENPRLGRGGELSFLTQGGTLWSLDHMNVRDDRMEFFGSLPVRKKVIVTYAARATTAGSFAVPPVEAEAMYDPKIWTRVAGNRVKVLGPWPSP